MAAIAATPDGRSSGITTANMSTAFELGPDHVAISIIVTASDGDTFAQDRYAVDKQRQWISQASI